MKSKKYILFSLVFLVSFSFAPTKSKGNDFLFRSGYYDCSCNFTEEKYTILINSIKLDSSKWHVDIELPKTHEILKLSLIYENDSVFATSYIDSTNKRSMFLNFSNKYDFLQTISIAGFGSYVKQVRTNSGGFDFKFQDDIIDTEIISALFINKHRLVDSFYYYNRYKYKCYPQKTKNIGNKISPKKTKKPKAQ